MQNARDTFYVTLRDRLQALNPARQVLLRGVWRPGVLVEENEAVSTGTPDNAFVLRWTKVEVDSQHALPLARQTCQIEYQSAGTATEGGLNRGVLLAAMDAELLSTLQPQQTTKMSYSVTPATPLGTRLWWTDPAFQPMTRSRDRLMRRAEVMVMSFEEAGE